MGKIAKPLMDLIDVTGGSLFSVEKSPAPPPPPEAEVVEPDQGVDKQRQLARRKRKRIQPTILGGSNEAGRGPLGDIARRKTLLGE